MEEITNVPGAGSENEQPDALSAFIENGRRPSTPGPSEPDPSEVPANEQPSPSEENPIVASVREGFRPTEEELASLTDDERKEVASLQLRAKNASIQLGKQNAPAAPVVANDGRVLKAEAFEAPASPLNARLAQKDEALQKISYIMQNLGDDDASKEQKSRMELYQKAINSSGFNTLDDGMAGQIVNGVNAAWDNTQKKRGTWETIADAFERGYNGTGNSIIMGFTAMKPGTLTQDDVDYLRGAYTAGQYYDIAHPQKIGSVKNIDSVGDALVWAAEGVGENATRTMWTAAASVAGGLVGGIPGAIAGSTMGSMPLNMGEAVGDQFDDGLKFNRGSVLAQGVGYSLLDGAFGVDVGMGKLAAKFSMKKAISNGLDKGLATWMEEVGKNATLKGTMKEIGKEALFEGVQEPAQSQIVGRTRRYLQTGSFRGKDESMQDAWINALDESLGGAVVGVAMGGAGHAMAHVKVNRDVKLYNDIYSEITKANDLQKVSTPAQRILVARYFYNQAKLASTAISDDERSAISSEQEKLEDAFDATAKAGDPSAKMFVDGYSSVFAKEPYGEVVSANSNGGLVVNGKKAVFLPEIDVDGMRRNHTFDSTTGINWYNDKTGIRIGVVKDNDGNDSYFVCNRPGLKMPLDTADKFDTLGNAVNFAKGLSVYNQYRVAKNAEMAQAVTRIAQGIFKGSGTDVAIYDSIAGVADDRSRAKLLGGLGVGAAYDKDANRVTVLLDNVDSVGKLYTVLAHEKWHNIIADRIMDKSPDGGAEALDKGRAKLFGKDSSGNASVANEEKFVEKQSTRAIDRMMDKMNPWYVRAIQTIKQQISVDLGISTDVITDDDARRELKFLANSGKVFMEPGKGGEGSREYVGGVAANPKAGAEYDASQSAQVAAGVPLVGHEGDFSNTHLANGRQVVVRQNENVPVEEATKQDVEKATSPSAEAKPEETSSTEETIPTPSATAAPAVPVEQPSAISPVVQKGTENPKVPENIQKTEQKPPEATKTVSNDTIVNKAATAGQGNQDGNKQTTAPSVVPASPTPVQAPIQAIKETAEKPSAVTVNPPTDTGTVVKPTVKTSKFVSDDRIPESKAVSSAVNSLSKKLVDGGEKDPEAAIDRIMLDPDTKTLPSRLAQTGISPSEVGALVWASYHTRPFEATEQLWGVARKIDERLAVPGLKKSDRQALLGTRKQVLDQINYFGNLQEEQSKNAPSEKTAPAAPALSLESVSQKQVNDEAKKAADQKKIQEGLAKPLKGGTEDTTPDMFPEVGSGTGELFHQGIKKPSPAKTVSSAESNFAATSEKAPPRTEAQDEKAISKLPAGNPAKNGLVDVKTEKADTLYRASATVTSGLPEFTKVPEKKGFMKPVVIAWKRNDGKVEIVHGRSYVESVRNANPEKLVPMKVYNESDGYTDKDMIYRDAVASIREKRGGIADYAAFIRSTGLSEDEFSRMGLGSSEAGRLAFGLLKGGTSRTAGAIDWGVENAGSPSSDEGSADHHIDVHTGALIARLAPRQGRVMFGKTFSPEEAESIQDRLLDHAINDPKANDESIRSLAQQLYRKGVNEEAFAKEMSPAKVLEQSDEWLRENAVSYAERMSKYGHPINPVAAEHISQRIHVRVRDSLTPKGSEAGSVADFWAHNSEGHYFLIPRKLGGSGKIAAQYEAKNGRAGHVVVRRGVGQMLPFPDKTDGKGYDAATSLSKQQQLFIFGYHNEKGGLDTLASEYSDIIGYPNDETAQDSIIKAAVREHNDYLAWKDNGAPSENGDIGSRVANEQRAKEEEQEYYDSISAELASLDEAYPPEQRWQDEEKSLDESVNRLDIEDQSGVEVGKTYDYDGVQVRVDSMGDGRITFTLPDGSKRYVYEEDQYGTSRPVRSENENLGQKPQGSASVDEKGIRGPVRDRGALPSQNGEGQGTGAVEQKAAQVPAAPAQVAAKKNPAPVGIKPGEEVATRRGKDGVAYGGKFVRDNRDGTVTIRAFRESRDGSAMVPYGNDRRTNSRIFKDVTIPSGLVGSIDANGSTKGMTPGELREFRQNSAIQDFQQDQEVEAGNYDIWHQNGSSVRFKMTGPVEESGDLVAVHNIYPAELSKSLRMGGLAMPSIAIVKAKNGHDQFGPISLVFGKESIDPKASRDNVIFEADAWTPTFPSVSREIKGGGYKILGKLYDSVGRKWLDESGVTVNGLNSPNIENAIVGEKTLDDVVAENEAVQATYLKKMDPKYETPKFIPSFMANVPNSEFEEINKILGDDADMNRLNDPKVEKRAFDKIHKFFSDKVFAQTGKRLSFSKWGREYELLNKIRDYREKASYLFRHSLDGKKFEEDFNRIAGGKDSPAFRSYVSGLTSDLELMEGINNNREPFDANGNRRSFSYLHLPLTAANVVRIMKKQQQQGSTIFASINARVLRANTAKKFGSIGAVKNYEGHLVKLTKEEADKEEKVIDSVIEDAKNAFAPAVTGLESYEKYDAVNSILSDAVSKARGDYSADNIARCIRFSYNDYFAKDIPGNQEVSAAKHLSEAIKMVKEMPTDMFEAKPRRVVGFSEVKAAIVPDTAKQDLVERMRRAGVQNIVTYKNEDEADRLAKLNSLPASIRFKQIPSLKEIDDRYVNAVDNGDDGLALSISDDAAQRYGFNEVGSHGSPYDKLVGNSFNRNMLGVNTGAPSAREGFFFAGQDTAASYSGSRTSEEWSHSDPIKIEGFLARIRKIVHSAIDEVPDYIFTNRDKSALSRYEARNIDTKFSYNPSEDHVNGIEGAWCVAENARDMAKYYLKNAMLDVMSPDHSITREDRRKFVKKIESANNDLNSFATNEEIEKTTIDSHGSVVMYYLKMNNPYVFDQKGHPYRDQSYYGIIRKAKREGYDSVIIKNTYDGGPLDDVKIVFNENQMKQRLPFPKDESGNVIPVSKRFGMTNDVRYKQFSENHENEKKKNDSSIDNERRPEFGNYSKKEIEDMVRADAEEVIRNEGFDARIVDARVYGSRSRGTNRANSDLDVMVQYEGTAREDDLFDALNADRHGVSGIRFDINPVNAEQSGTIDEHIANSDRMRAEDAAAKNNPKPDIRFKSLSDPETENVTRIDYRGVNAWRERMGLDPIDRGSRIDFMDFQSKVRSYVAAHPSYVNEVIDRAINRGTDVDDMARAALLDARADADRRFSEVSERLVSAQKSGDPAAIEQAQSDYELVRKSVDDIDTALRRSGSAAGLVLRQMQLARFNDPNRDELATIRREYATEKAKQGDTSPLTEDELKKTQTIADELRSRNAAIEAELKKALARVEELEAQADRSDVQAAISSVRSRSRGVNPKAAADRATKAKNRFSRDMETAKGTAREADVTNDFLRQMLRSYVEQGIEDRDEIVRLITNDLNKMIEGFAGPVSTKEVMRMLSGYGRQIVPRKDAVSRRVRDLVAQYLKLTQIADATENGRVLKTGLQRDDPSAEVRELTKQLHDIMKEMGINAASREQMLKSALDSAKTRMRNEIEDLERAISKNEKMKERMATGSVSDDELDSLRSRRDELKVQYNIIFNIQQEKDDARLAKLVKAAKDRRDAAQARLAQAKLDFESGKRVMGPGPGASRHVTSDELEAIRSETEEANAEFRHLVDLTDPEKSPEEVQARRFAAVMKRQIEEIDRRIREHDFGPRPSRPKADPERMSPALRTLYYQREQARARLKRMIDDYRLRHSGYVNRGLNKIGDLFNIIRALRSSFDLSAVLRQGGVVAISHPVIGAKAFAPMMKALKNEDTAIRTFIDLKDRPNYAYYDKAGLYLATLDSNTADNTAAEDAFRINLDSLLRRADRTLPVRLVKGGVRASERAYVTYLNAIRAEAFDSLVASTPSGRADMLSDAELKAIANYVNIATGRGTIGDSSATGNKFLSALFWSPRNLAARFQFLFGQPLYRGSALTRKMVAKEYAKYALGLATIYALGAVVHSLLKRPDDPPDQPFVEFDPRSSDFMKFRLGNTRIDPLSGLSQVTVFTARMITGKTKNGYGEVQNLSGSGTSFKNNKANVIVRFIRSKLSPLAGYCMDTASGTTYNGDPLVYNTFFDSDNGPSFWQESAANFVPLSGSDVWSAIKDRGISQGTVIGALSILGAGVQVWDRENYASASREYKHWRTALKQAKTREDALAIYRDHDYLKRSSAIDAHLKAIEQLNKGVKAYQEVGKDPSRFEDMIGNERKIVLNLILGAQNPTDTKP